MFTTRKKIGTLIGIAFLVTMGCEQPANVQKEGETSLEHRADELIKLNNQPIEGRYIVIIDDHIGKSKATAGQIDKQITAITGQYHIQDNAISSRYRYAIGGFSAELTPEQVNRLKRDSGVQYVEKDRVVMLSPPRSTGSFWCIFFGIGCDSGSGGSQEIPYGITRVGGPIDGEGLTAWVIDTGVDLDHDDLRVDTQRSISFVEAESSADDKNGHGTHVSGTIAALDNDIDVVGVAAGATVVGVKVLDRNGSGTFSGVIDGVDYVAANASPGDAANLSLGGGSFQALDDAVRNAAAQGIYFAVAAGNDGENAVDYSPARVDHENVWTISAVDKKDSFASFSNFGNPPVDYTAPGVSVKSLWKSNRTNTISGTSMATPHAAGVLLITGGNPQSDGFASDDPDGNPDPIAHN